MTVPPGPHAYVYRYQYLIGVDSFVHRPGGHEEVDRPRGKLGRQFIELAELLHVVDNRVVLGGVFLRLVKYGRDLSEDQGEKDS